LFTKKRYRSETSSKRDIRKSIKSLYLQSSNLKKSNVIRNLPSNLIIWYVAEIQWEDIVRTKTKKISYAGVFNHKDNKILDIQNFKTCTVADAFRYCTSQIIVSDITENSWKTYQNNKDIKHKSRNKIAPKRNLDREGLDYSQVPQTR
jgi:hypothetical protein